jgi:hypothetical protein
MQLFGCEPISWHRITPGVNPLGMSLRHRTLDADILQAPSYQPLGMDIEPIPDKCNYLVERSQSMR